MRVLHRLKRVFSGLLLAAVSTVVTLSLLELGVRLLLPQQLIQLRSDVWTPHDGLGWRHTPHLDVAINTGERTVRLYTDARGFRIGAPDEREATPPRYRVLALGDSFIEAIQVEARDTMTAQLASALTERLGAAVETVNTGVGGWGPNQYLLQARAELPRGGYQAVVVFLFQGNDIVAWRTDHVEPRRPAGRRTLRLPRSLGKRELVDAVAFPINNALETRSHLFTLVKARLKFLLMRVGLSQHYFPETLRTRFRDGDHWETTADIVHDIAQLATAHGAPTLVVLLPGVYQVDRAVSERYVASLGIDPDAVDLDQPATLLGAALAARGVDMLDATPALRAAHDTGEGPLYGRVDTHLAPAGHRVVARAVAPIVSAWLIETAGDTEAESTAGAAP